MTSQASLPLTTSRRVKRSWFESRVTAAGATAFTLYNNMPLATVFRSLEDDYRHLKDHVQLWDVSAERQVEITGPDASRLVQWMTPRNLSKAQTGRCFYAPLCDVDGGMVNDPIILKIADDRFWLSIADSDVALWARGVAAGKDLEARVSVAEVFPIAIQGPKAEDVTALVLGDEVRDIRFFQWRYIDFQGHPLVVARSGWSKQGGFEIYVDQQQPGLALWDAIMKAGEPFSIRVGCPNLIERIEGGLLSYNVDMDSTTSPLEAGLEKYCDLESEHRFLARRALEKQQEKGIARRLAGLRFDDPEIPILGSNWPVYANGETVGDVRSAATSPDLGCGIAIAMLDLPHAAEGSRVDVETDTGTVQASVTTLPFKPKA